MECGWATLSKAPPSFVRTSRKKPAPESSTPVTLGGLQPSSQTDS